MNETGKLHPGSPDTTEHATALARRRTVLAGLALAGAGLLPQAQAQAPGTWPNRPIRIFIPSGAGSGGDIFGRQFAEYLGRELGQPVIVDNKPGGTGIVAAEAMVRLPPDGYNLLISFAAAILGNKAMAAKMQHDPITDLKPVGIIGGDGGNLLIVSSSVPANNIKELLDWVKAQGQTVGYGSWGIGSGGHLVMEAILGQAGIRMNHIPYKTVGQIPQDLLAGVLQVATIDSATPVPLIKAGKVRAVATLSAKRFPLIPEVPTMIEQGYSLEALPWYGLFGQAALPDPIVKRLNELLNRWLVLPETVQFFATRQNSQPPVPKSPEEFALQIQRELPAWRKMVKIAGL